MKKFVGCLMTIIFLSVFGNAQAETSQKLPKHIQLNISFDWQQPNEPFANEVIHVKKTITVYPDQTNYNVVTSETRADDKLPITWALLVKPSDVTRKQMTAVFMLVQYGLNHNGEIIAQPKIIFNNGQMAEMFLAGDNKAIKLKVFAKWS